MYQNKIVELMKDSDFIKKVISQDTIKGVQELFDGEGVKLSAEEVELLGDIIDTTAKKGKVISDADLESSSGGGDGPARLLGGLVGALSGAVVGAMGGGYAGDYAGKEFCDMQHDSGAIGVLGKAFDSVSGKNKSDRKNFKQGGIVIGSVAGSLAGGALGVSAAQGICNFLKKGSKK